jgi:hypothetical protein
LAGETLFSKAPKETTLNLHAADFHNLCPLPAIHGPICHHGAIETPQPTLTRPLPLLPRLGRIAVGPRAQQPLSDRVS